MHPFYLTFHQTDSDHNSTFDSEASPSKWHNQPICGTLHTIQDHISTAALVGSLQKKGQYSKPVHATFNFTEEHTETEGLLCGKYQQNLSYFPKSSLKCFIGLFTQRENTSHLEACVGAVYEGDTNRALPGRPESKHDCRLLQIRGTRVYSQGCQTQIMSSMNKQCHMLPTHYWTYVRNTV